MVTKRLRFEILRRDNHTCRYCGAKPGEGELHVDHVIPTALGGGDEPANLVCACKDCNTGKSSIAPDSPLVDQVADDALRWAAAMKKVAEVRAEERREKEGRLEPFAEAWDKWHYGYDEKNVPLDADWERSVERFLDAGLEIDDLLDMVKAAMQSQAAPTKTWRYFCGCAWNLLKERQEAARALLEVEEAEGE